MLKHTRAIAVPLSDFLYAIFETSLLIHHNQSFQENNFIIMHHHPPQYNNQYQRVQLTRFHKTADSIYLLDFDQYYIHARHLDCSPSFFQFSANLSAIFH